MPPLNALRAFEAAARHLSFTAAADELCVTPGAVSRQVFKLEQFLGGRLFTRRNRQVLLTRRGQTYRREVADIFERIVRATAAAHAGGAANVLRVVSPPTCAGRWLVPRLARFHALHPGLNVRITTSYEPVDFAQGDVDVAILYGTALDPDLAGERLFDEVLIPVCRRALLGRAETLSPRALSRRVLLHSLRRPDDWRHWFEGTGVADAELRRELTFENSTLTFEAAVAGLGVAIAQAAFVSADLLAGTLVVPVDRPVRRDTAYFLAYAGHCRPARKVALFRDWLLAEARAA